MENLVAMKNTLSFLSGKKVFVTGHTGFKGTWLTLILLSAGADVYGYSLPLDDSTHFHSSIVNNPLIKLLPGKLVSCYNDILDFSSLSKFFNQSAPDYLFHLAAQPLVQASYTNPLYTWQANVNGTLHVLELLRSSILPLPSVFITTDKVYDNKEWAFGYREIDPLGGHDPYSSSKAACELAIDSWRRSFFSASDNPIPVASVRAGNVIGGGDWSPNRLVPDIIRSFLGNSPVIIRYPNSRRPWQHVLDPLHAYIQILEGLTTSPELYSSAFNVGPSISSNKTVKELCQEILKHIPGSYEISTKSYQHEATNLHLNSDLLSHLSGWQPSFDFQLSVKTTCKWYQSCISNTSSPFQACVDDLNTYYDHRS